MGLKILVVEDDKHTRRILEALFRNDPELSGRVDDVFTAGDGQEALALFEAERPDLVVTDLLMPRLDGFGLCRGVRAKPYGRDTALIAISAVYKDAAVIRRLKDEFGAAFFQKPFQVRDLVRAASVIAGRKAHGEDEQTRPAPRARALTPARGLPGVAPAETEGDLAQRPLAGLLLDVLERQLTATLVLRRDRIRKEIFLLVGHPIGAESNVRQETLGYYLVARRVINEEQHHEALALSRREGVKLGQALVKLGALKNEDVIKHLGALVRLKVVSSLRWSHGQYQLVPGDTFSDRVTKAVIEPVALILSGLKRTAHDDEIAKQLAARAAARVALTPRAERYRDAFAKVFGVEALAALAARPLLGELLRRGQGGVALLGAVDALLQTAMAELDDPAAALAHAGAPRASQGIRATAAFAAITDAVPQADPLALSNLALPTAPGPAASPPADDDAAAPGSASLYAELFGGETSQVAPVPQAPPAVGAADGVVMQPLDLPESGIIELLPSAERMRAFTPITHVPPPPADPRLERARQLILKAYLEIHDKNFYEVLGVAPEAPDEEITGAYAAASRKFRLADFEGLDLGRDYGRLEELNVIFRRAYEVLADPARRLEYDRRIGVGGTMPERPGMPGAPATDPFAAEILFHDGEAQLQAGDFAAAAAAFEQAAVKNPEAADYHAHAAWALFRARGEGGLEAARGHLDQAFLVDADLASAHDFAGRIAFELGDDDEALPHLERALDLDPGRLDAFSAIEQILTRHKDWRRLERQYRKLIHRVGEEGDNDLLLRLWWNLAEIYRTRVGDLESARVAFEIACRLAPDEPALHQALAEVTGRDPARWGETARALRGWWRLRPDDPTPGRALFALHRGGDRADAALVAAAALAARGIADAPAAEEFLRAYGPRFLVRLPRLDATLWQRLRHPDDDPDLGDLFALLAPIIRELHPFTLGDLEVSELDRVLPAEVPDAFQRVLGYVCGLFGVAEPAIYRRADFGAEAHVGGTEPPVLLVGPEALGESDRAVLAFRLGRAATYLWPGRAAGGALPSRLLKGFLLGSMVLTVPGLTVEDPDGAVEALRQRLALLPPEVQARLRDLVARISREKTSLNLSRWARSLARSADRAGLLVCNDLCAAVRVVAQTGVRGAEDELIDFALSEPYLEAREALGLAVAI
ncbi:MAG TPA: response regulator [Polyangia bacterium]|jgi:CheY-like chemotaxis protein/tetratricopeptide (TPR) repeat protein